MYQSININQSIILITSVRQSFPSHPHPRRSINESMISVVQVNQSITSHPHPHRSTGRSIDRSIVSHAPSIPNPHPTARPTTTHIHTYIHTCTPPTNTRAQGSGHGHHASSSSRGGGRRGEAAAVPQDWRRGAVPREVGGGGRHRPDPLLAAHPVSRFVGRSWVVLMLLLIPVPQKKN